MKSALAARPWLIAAFGIGVLVWGGLSLWGRLDMSTNVILGWDAVWATYLSAALYNMMSRSTNDMRNRAAKEDEGRLVILVLVLLAAVLSVAAVAAELSLAKDSEGLAKALRVALAFITVGGSWFMVQLVFALHYAHGFYDQTTGSTKHDAGGLKFPGTGTPDYWDFLHFAVVIGVASQTADIAITSKALRRLATVHSLFAFVFNTVIVALTINLLASLFGGGS